MNIVKFILPATTWALMLNFWWKGSMSFWQAVKGADAGCLENVDNATRSLYSGLQSNPKACEISITETNVALSMRSSLISLTRFQTTTWRYLISVMRFPNQNAAKRKATNCLKNNVVTCSGLTLYLQIMAYYVRTWDFF